MFQRGNGLCDALPDTGAGGERVVFQGRYRGLRALKTGQGVETFLGEDLIDNGRVIIKAASGDYLSQGARMRLEHEAQVLRELRSPWFAPLLCLGRENDRLFLVMPYLPGVTLE